jgi:hypothetical protein
MQKNTPYVFLSIIGRLKNDVFDMSHTGVNIKKKRLKFVLRNLFGRKKYHLFFF